MKFGVDDKFKLVFLHRQIILSEIEFVFLCRSLCMDFLPPSGGVFRLALARSSPGIPCRRSFGFQGAVRDLAIRKLKTCSDSFGSRAGTLRQICYIKLLRWITTKIELCQQKVLKTRCFRQGARKSEGNFGKKREGWTAPALLTELNIKAPELFLKKSRFRIVFTARSH